MDLAQPQGRGRAFRAALLAPDVGFTIAYGVSGNTRRWWDEASARALGYEPQDDAERSITDLAEKSEPGDELQGGPFADRG